MIVNRPIKRKHLSRYNILYIIMAVIFTAIVLKLAYYQILNYDDYKEKANTISTRFISEKAPRGKIYDRNGYVLATNKQTYSITYTAPEKDDKDFFNTMKELFKILDENNETLQDTMNLKIDEDDNLYFEYMTSDKSAQDIEEKRFKKDRGIDYLLQRQMFKDEDELNESQSDQLDKALLDLSPEETFNDLVKIYGLVGLIDPEYNSDKNKDMYSKMSPEDITKKILNEGYSLNEIRKFMLVKDAIKMQSFKGYKSVTITSNIQRNTALIIYQKLNELPGIDVGLTPIRYYPFKELASSVLGYVSSINSSQQEEYELMGYDVSSDLVGKAGIESAFEEQLKGTKGGSTVKVNSQGRPTEELFKLESAPGNDVHLTIDSDIQYAAEHSLADKIQELQSSGFRNATRGAAVAVDVKSGKILALVSYPNYDPNLFTLSGNLTSDEYKTYFNPDFESFGNEFINKMGLGKSLDELFPKSDGGLRSDPYDLYPRPFYNYATMSLIPPGSTFKPLTAVAGLESGAIEPSTIIVDKGKFDEHPETFGKGFNPSGLEYNQTGSGVGPTSLTQAIAESINYYFYETAYRMYKLNGSNLEALDSIAKYAWQFGLGIDPKSNNTPATGIEIKENFGQTYNFDSWKRSKIASSKFSLVQQLENGYYEGKNISFIAFDIGINEEDNEKLAEAKKNIKDKVADALDKVGTDEQIKSVDDFAKSLKNDINDIMESSDKYKANIEKAKSEGKNVDLKEQANIIANVIATFTINDITTEIRSPGEIVNASIGQGMNNFTPLQLVSYISTLANGGTRYKLTLVDEITDNNGNVVQKFQPEVLNTVDMLDTTKEAVKAGMAAVNNEEGGTARSTFGTFPIPTAGKTGTADARANQKEVGREPYATYVSYAPVDDPEIAVAAVVFDGGHGSSIASVVKSIYEAYFKDRLLEQYPNYAGMSSTFKKYVADNPNVELEKQTQYNPEN